MTEKRFTTVELPKPNRWGIWYDGACLSTYQVCILLNEYVDVKKENEQLKSVNQELRNELKFDEKMYTTFKEIIDEADDLIISHLSKHYQRKWKNFCKYRGVLYD